MVRPETTLVLHCAIACGIQHGIPHVHPPYFFVQHCTLHATLGDRDPESVVPLVDFNACLLRCACFQGGRPTLHLAETCCAVGGLRCARSLIGERPLHCSNDLLTFNSLFMVVEAGLAAFSCTSAFGLTLLGVESNCSDFSGGRLPSS